MVCASHTAGERGSGDALGEQMGATFDPGQRSELLPHPPAAVGEELDPIPLQGGQLRQVQTPTRTGSQSFTR